MIDKKLREGEKKTDWKLLGSGLGLFGGSVCLGVVADMLGTNHPSFGRLAVNQEVSLFAAFIIFGGLLLLVGLPILMSLLNEKTLWWLLLFLIFSLPLIGTSSYSILNKKLDNSDAQLFVGVIVGKRAVGSKSRSYLLQVSPNNSQEIFEFSPPYQDYQESTIGNHISIEFHQGYFGKHWISNYSIEMSPHLPPI
jgi:predicted permease